MSDKKINFPSKEKKKKKRNMKSEDCEGCRCDEGEQRLNGEDG
ncbi:hypothetical protein HanPI659440_Chr14g0570641 [Helianthus annuus]|nr:hypothetical protein HanPI659440_Chr14g0570641 [Helianthus annuus]